MLTSYFSGFCFGLGLVFDMKPGRIRVEETPVVLKKHQRSWEAQFGAIGVPTELGGHDLASQDPSAGLPAGF